VGDNVYIKDELYRVKKISLLYTEMIAMNGEVSRIIHMVVSGLFLRLQARQGE
jgi:hypothetical protein